MPVSIEALIQRRQEEERQQKPTFLSKHERERLRAERESKRENETERRPEEHRTGETAVRTNGKEDAKQDGQGFGTRKKRRTEKFSFAWDGSEDTSEQRGLEEGPKVERLLPAEERMRVQTIMDERRRREEATQRVAERHWWEKGLEEMKDRDWRILKDDLGIAIKGGGQIPHPMRSWRESGLSQRLLSVVERAGYRDPTPIQRAAIPIAMTSRDLIGIAETGSGKTASFVLPLLHYISSLPHLDQQTYERGPYALILAPTRELAQQIEAETRKFAAPLGMRCTSIVGGHRIEEQVHNLRNGAEIVIATPGRLIDCLEQHILVLAQCFYLIMDEADRMIDLGFEADVNRILESMPRDVKVPHVPQSQALVDKRFTMMYTATMPPAIERLAKNYLQRAAIVTIGNAGQGAVETIEQRVEFLASEDAQRKRLLQVLSDNTYTPPVIIFVNFKKTCDVLAKDLRQIGWRTVILHGGKSQDQREDSLSQLRAGTADVLVATDVAGRGIDVADVSLVVNFNMAKSIEDYMHRIGRTGRAGKSGIAITFLTDADNDVLWDLKRVLIGSPVSRVPEDLRRHPAAQQKFIRPS